MADLSAFPDPSGKIPAIIDPEGHSFTPPALLESGRRIRLRGRFDQARL